MARNKKWFYVIVSTRNGEKVFEDNTRDWAIIAKVQSKGNAYTVAKALGATYKPEHFMIVVE